MKHFAPAAPHLRAAVPVVGMVKLLQERKAALESMVAERHRAAREAGTVADVKQLSATLRAVKRQIAECSRPHGQAQQKGAVSGADDATLAPTP